MKAALLVRTSAAPIHYHSSSSFFVSDSPRTSLSVSGVFSSNNNGSASTSLHCCDVVRHHGDSTPARKIMRVSSSSETADPGGKVGAYYKEMLKSDPCNSLLLTNYGRFLHQVEGDMVKAEEYYGRAIVGSPGDGEVLSLYGTLIWETQRDQDRANSYFDQARNASPKDCMVLGSYAHFMWEAEEEDEEDGGDSRIEREN